MKILHINTTDNGGGSAIVAKRLNKSLQNNGVESKLLVLDKTGTSDNSIIGYFDNHTTKVQKIVAMFKRHFLPTYYNWKIRNIYDAPEIFTFPKSLIDITNIKEYDECDIVHLHNVYDFVNVGNFFKQNKKPIVWTFHDMNPFTGGFHIYFDDINYSNEILSIANDNLIIKKNAYRYLNKYYIVTPSDWMFTACRNAGIFDPKLIGIIPNGINLNIFKPHNKEFSREVLNLPKNKKTILFIADDHNRENKGKEDFMKVYNKIGADYNFIIAGKNTDCDEYKRTNIFNFGFVNSENMLSLIYSASDITLLPSIRESFSLVTLESLACGVPVVCYNTTGPSEIIVHKENGFLSEIGNYNDLIIGIKYILSDDTGYKTLSNNAVIRAKNYDIEMISQKYLDIYKSLI